MYIIGENIHILSDKVKEALANRDREFFMDSAVKQVEGRRSGCRYQPGTAQERFCRSLAMDY